ncbi:Bug family tripartite tricarboxylate transporter substrate binding protein [Nonomuraea typhae]|uniref:Bug family tripartite tricarboxylate transporter substrate binding protein n=1 Tax=Nonomuraea typhae TaxID=2603600 RepID=A0ABW7ZAG4_9ACTN
MGTHPLTPVSAIRLCVLTSILAVTATACAGRQAADQGGSWQPRQDVRLIIHASAGGASDLMARTAAKVLTDQKIVTRPVLAENREGGSGAVAYTYLLGQAGNPHYIAAFSGTYMSTPASNQADYRYTNYTNYSVVAEDASVLVVSAASPYRKLADLVRAAKDRPDTVRYGGTQTGGADSIVHYLLQQKTGTKLAYVPFDGGSEASAALLGGNVDVISSNPSEIKSLIDAGRIRPLAVSSTARIAGLDIPTFREQDVDLVSTQARGFIGPPRVSAAQRSYWENALTRMTESGQWRDYVRANFLQPSVHIGQNAQRYLDQEWQKYVSLYKELGLRPK